MRLGVAKPGTPPGSKPTSTDCNPNCPCLLEPLINNNNNNNNNIKIVYNNIYHANTSHLSENANE